MVSSNENIMSEISCALHVKKHEGRGMSNVARRMKLIAEKHA